MDIPEIDIDELEQLLAAGALVVDVREDDERAAAHITHTRHVPLGEIPASTESLASPEPIYVMCAKGGRSAQAVEFLRGHGIDAINVAGGMSAWLEAGKPAQVGS